MFIGKLDGVRQDADHAEDVQNGKRDENRHRELQEAIKNDQDQQGKKQQYIDFRAEVRSDILSCSTCVAAFASFNADSEGFGPAPFGSAVLADR